MYECVTVKLNNFYSIALFAFICYYYYYAHIHYIQLFLKRWACIKRMQIHMNVCMMQKKKRGQCCWEWWWWQWRCIVFRTIYANMHKTTTTKYSSDMRIHSNRANECVMFAFQQLKNFNTEYFLFKNIYAWVFFMFSVLGHWRLNIFRVWKLFVIE